MKVKAPNTNKVRTLLLALCLPSGLLGTTLILGQGGTGRETPNANSNKKPPTKRTTTPRKTGSSTANNNKAKPDEAADERVFWESVKNSTDPADFNSYLKKYPNGQYADLARNSLRRLEAANSNSNTSTPATPAEKGSLGVIPSYDQSSDGVKLDGVRDNSPAAGAGLKAGDKIVRLAGRDVKNVTDLQPIIGTMKPGQEYEVEIVRASLRLTLKITPTGQSPASSTIDAGPVLFPPDGRKPESGDSKGNASNDPAGEKVFTGKEVDQRAQILSKPKPMYTDEARKNLISGTVVLRAVLAADGRVTNIRVIQGLPNGLTEEAIAAAMKVKFTPAMKDGHPVSQSIQFEYNFSPY